MNDDEDEKEEVVGAALLLVVLVVVVVLLLLVYRQVRGIGSIKLTFKATKQRFSFNVDGRRESRNERRGLKFSFLEKTRTSDFPIKKAQTTLLYH